MSTFWSPFVATLSPYTPGEQPKGQSFIKLNTNENPYGPSLKALEAMRTETGDSLRLYPDPEGMQLRRAIAESYGLGTENVFVGNGSDEVLGHAFNAFFRDKGELLFPEISYSFYPTYCSFFGIPYRKIALNADFTLDPARFAKAPAGVVIANPNAPTGIALPLAAIETVLKANPEVVVLIDEAYVDFGGESAAALVARYANLLVVQTFSKSRSLAGLRVGFALGQPALIEGLMRVKDSFNSYPLGRVALAGATAAWEDHAHFDATRKAVMRDREATSEALARLGFTTLPSATNFIFTRHASLPAEEILAALRARGILVRHFKQDAIRNWLRISIGTSAECQALVEALREITAAA